MSLSHLNCHLNYKFQKKLYPVFLLKNIMKIIISFYNNLNISF